MTGDGKPNVQGVRLVLSGADVVRPPANDGGDGGTRSRADGLPPGCPVTPLGVDGELCFYLDANRQLRALRAKDHGRLGIAQLFGDRLTVLYEHWPNKRKVKDENGNEEWVVLGWKPEKVAEDLMAACARFGVWDAFDRVRGPGAWVGEDGELVLHVGDQVWRNGAYGPPGQIDRFVYPAAPPTPRMAHAPVPAAADGGPSKLLLEMLSSWRWKRGDLDAYLMLGWIGAAMLGGALEWRPLAWITGGAATGKSTLHKLLKQIFESAIVSVSDASAAGIWQRTKQSSLPIAVDELEAEEDNRKSSAVIKLARQAASGGVILRGGAEHKGAEFVTRSCFLFSSILVPPLPNQDRQRMAILELDELAPGTKPLRLDPRLMSQLGSGLRRRLADGWPRMEQTLDLYRQGLGRHGHSGRSADQFGTLLAIADLLMADGEPDPEVVEGWADRLAAETLREMRDQVRDEDKMIGHLLTMPVEPYRGGRMRPLSALVMQAAGRAPEGGEGSIDANEALQSYGLKVIMRQGRPWLAIANDHSGLAKLFERTHWAGGVWVQAARRLRGFELGNLKFATLQRRCTEIPLDTVLPEDAPDPDDADRSAGPAEGLDGAADLPF